MQAPLPPESESFDSYAMPCSARAALRCCEDLQCECPTVRPEMCLLAPEPLSGTVRTSCYKGPILNSHPAPLLAASPPRGVEVLPSILSNACNLQKAPPNLTLIFFPHPACPALAIIAPSLYNLHPFRSCSTDPSPPLPFPLIIFFTSPSQLDIRSVPCPQNKQSVLPSSRSREQLGPPDRSLPHQTPRRPQPRRVHPTDNLTFTTRIFS